MEKVGLAEAVEALRGELASAAAAAAAKGLRFRVDQVQLELEVMTERATTGGAGLQFWVVEASAERSSTVGRTHRVSVTLTPLTPEGPLHTADDQLPE